MKEKSVIQTEAKKNYIVWHGSGARTKHTPYGKLPGKATSIIDSWNNSGEKQGAAYVVDRDGIVYKAFDDDRWSYHLNIPNTRGFYDKQSVGIVLANELNLIQESGRYYAFGYPHLTNEYNGKIVKQAWHNESYWAALDKDQVDSAVDLTLKLCQKYNIEPLFYNHYEWDPKAWDKATIFMHSVVKKEVNDFPPLEGWVIDKIKARGIKVLDS